MRRCSLNSTLCRLPSCCCQIRVRAGRWIKAAEPKEKALWGQPISLMNHLKYATRLPEIRPNSPEREEDRSAGQDCHNRRRQRDHS
jgi:hypothetical protein